MILIRGFYSLSYVEQYAENDIVCAYFRVLKLISNVKWLKQFGIVIPETASEVAKQVGCMSNLLQKL